MLEKFYEIIYTELSKLDLDGQYYADWTADELFIIFYGSDEEKKKITNESLRFCHTLATKLYIDVSNHVNQDIKYDIGLSSGHGLIGLQGPGRFKKTTITGDVAGHAKRFETQAKEIRKEIHGHSFPIIVMDKQLKNASEALGQYKTHPFSNTQGNIKDIEGMELSYWQFQDN